MLTICVGVLLINGGYDLTYSVPGMIEDLNISMINPDFNVGSLNRSNKYLTSPDIFYVYYSQIRPKNGVVLPYMGKSFTVFPLQSRYRVFINYLHNFKECKNHANYSICAPFVAHNISTLYLYLKMFVPVSPHQWRIWISVFFS